MSIVKNVIRKDECEDNHSYSEWITVAGDSKDSWFAPKLITIKDIRICSKCRHVDYGKVTNVEDENILGRY